MDIDGIYYDAPPGYIVPPFPSLFSPFSTPIFLYSPYQIWRFTLLWTLILYSGIYLISASFYMLFAKRHLRLSIVAALFQLAWGGFGAFLSATIVGYALAAVYQSAFLRMSTWTPALWAFIQTTVLVSTSLRTFQSML